MIESDAHARSRRQIAMQDEQAMKPPLWDCERNYCRHDLGRGVLVTDLLGGEDGPTGPQV